MLSSVIAAVALNMPAAASAASAVDLPEAALDGFYITLDEVRANSREFFNAFAGPDGGPISHQEFVTKKLPEQQGFAANVLSQVNQLASSQPPDAAVERVQASAREAAGGLASLVDTSIKANYGGLSGKSLDDAQLTAARKAVRGEMADYVHRGGAAETLKAGLREAIDLAAGTAYDRFNAIQEASMEKIQPNDPAHPEYEPVEGTEPPTPREVFIGLKGRHAKLTREEVIAQNRKIWAA